MSDWNNKKEKRPRKDLVAELSRLTADNENLEYANDFCGKEISRLTARIEQLESEAKSVRDYIEAVYGVPRMRSESSIAALDVLDSRLSKESRINQMKDKRIELLEAVLVAIVNFDHDQDCLPGCDSIMHEDLCPFCNPELVMIDMAKKAIAAEDKDDAG